MTLAFDIYAFAMLILEAMTDMAPWERMIDAAVRFQVKRGGFPLRPDCLSDSQWSLIKMMCGADFPKRVQISFVVDKLYEFWQQQHSSEKEVANGQDSSDAP